MSKSAKPTGPSFETGMLAYARSLQITEGVFFARSSAAEDNKRVPVQILEKGVRGQTSNDLKPANYKDAGNSNPQSVEFAVVPMGCDLLDLTFSLRVLPHAMAPHACGNSEVGETYRRFAEGYKAAGGFRTLAELYLWNIANGRFAWRNRFQSDEMSVQIARGGDIVRFDPSKLSLEKPATVPEFTEALTQGSEEDIEDLIDDIARGLSSDEFGSTFIASVTWTGKMEEGQELFPSQEYLRESVQNQKEYKDISRILAKLPAVFGGQSINQASMHSQKIGAALRHIDVWHGDDDYQAIAVNPYGGVQETSAVLRSPTSKNSFYDIRKKAQPLLDAVEGATSAEQLDGNTHFFMANLVRGGVFGAVNTKAEANG